MSKVDYLSNVKRKYEESIVPADYLSNYKLKNADNMCKAGRIARFATIFAALNTTGFHYE